MIKNIYELPIGLRWSFFGSDWLTAAELTVFARYTFAAISKMEISKAELARRAGVSDATVFNRFGGRHIGHKSVSAIANVLIDDAKVPMQALLCDMGSAHTIVDEHGNTWDLIKTTGEKNAEA